MSQPLPDTRPRLLNHRLLHPAPGCALQIGENYALTGEESNHKRRDLRKGVRLTFCACCFILPCWLSNGPRQHSPYLRMPTAAGQHTGHVEVTPLGDLLLYLVRICILCFSQAAHVAASCWPVLGRYADTLQEWPQPFGGTGKERYHVLDPDYKTLLVETQLNVGDLSVTYKTFYRRRGIDTGGDD